MTDNESKKNKYTKELEKEKEALKKNNPFMKKTTSKPVNKEMKRKPYHVNSNKKSGYFSLILGTDFKDMELRIKGLRYVSYINGTGKEIVELEKQENHYLSESGAEDIIAKIEGHLSTDIKLGYTTQKEFLIQQRIITKTFIKYIKNNLEKLGMDTEDKQRNARPLVVFILNRIRSVYSQSIAGQVSKMSHGDISLSGGLDEEKTQKFLLEEGKN